MAKKRRDKERDTSTIGKITKVGTAALAVGVGAAVFNKNTYRKIVSETLPAAIKTKNQIQKEFRDLRSVRKGFDKRLSANDIKKVYNDNFINKNTFKINKEAFEKSKTKLTANKNSIYGKSKTIRQFDKAALSLKIKDIHRSELKQKTIDNLIVNKFKDKNSKHVNELALDAFEKIKEFRYNTNKDPIGKTNYEYGDFLKKKFKAFGFNDKERKDFLDIISDDLDLIESSKFAHSDINDKIINEVEKRVLEGADKSNLLHNKINKLLKKATGIDFNLEDKLIGGRYLTGKDLKEILATDSNYFDESGLLAKTYNSKTGKPELVNLKQDLQNILNKESNKDIDFDNLVIDKSIKVYRDSDGVLQAYNTQALDDIKSRFYEKFSSTSIGRILFQTDENLAKNKTPLISIRKAGSTGIEAAYEIGNETTRLRNAKLVLGNGNANHSFLYDIHLDENDNLVFNSSPLAEGLNFNNKHGKRSRLTRERITSNREVIEKYYGEIGEKLDIGQDGTPTLFKRIETAFTKFNDEEWEKNIYKKLKGFSTTDYTVDSYIEKQVFDYLQENSFEIANKSADEVAEIVNHLKSDYSSKLLKQHKALSTSLNNFTSANQIDRETISVLRNSGLIKDKQSIKILDALDNDDLSLEQLLDNIALNENGQIDLISKDLKNIYTKSLLDEQHIANMQNISQHEGVWFSLDSTNVLDSKDIIKREAVKEVLLKELAIGKTSVSGKTEYDLSHLENILQNDSLDGVQKKNLRYLANWGIVQDVLKIENDIDTAIELSSVIGESGTITHFKSLIESNVDFKAGYYDMIDDLSSSHNIFDKGNIGNINEVYTDEYNSYSFQKKSALHIDNLLQINSINDMIKTAGDAAKEIMAGPDDMQNYTTLTQLFQFGGSRLDWAIKDLGLGFSKESTKSNLDFVKNVAMKRVLPIAAAFQLYDYLDYESENITGISMTGAAANSLANIDLATRRLADSTGIGKAIDWFKETSVIGEYWTGSTDFQTQEERQEWYENGYQAVRGSRFWGFGSTSEYRGSYIQYYQPNYLKRAHSNWKEIGTYGSAEEKFKHSWLPSLRHPLSPLRAALDPYWLEKKNMDSRPYPMTGKLFAEGTPWGAILNPTVGELLKPVRMLPEVKRRLGKDGRDIRTVLQGINERIKNRGNENNDLLIAKGTDIRTADYISYSNTGDGSLNISFNNGQPVTYGLDYMSNVDRIRKYSPSDNIQNIGEGNEYANILPQNDEGLNNLLSMLEGINNGIRQTASQITPSLGIGQGSVNSYISNLPNKSEGTYVYTNLVSQRNTFNSNYYSSNYDPQMIDKNLVNNYMKDMTHSIKQLSGIYGFLSDFTFGEQSYTFEYEHAGNMTSFSRHFWDAQVGGIGGQVMEIARRFFPSEDKSRIRYNPLRNNMEEWLPEKFLTGDPYASLPKGEMRLPGKGYESINELHPDRFGIYGAFDRMKILGDIAPTSQEYKTWRNIARNTITDANLIKQMDEIEERAQKMSSKHEFYDYRYTKNNVQMNKGVIKSLNGNVVELVSGEKLALGGINLNETADLSQVLKVGQHIHYRTSKDAIKRLEDGIETNAVIYSKDAMGATNINKELINLGMAEKNKKDKTAIGYLASASPMQQTIGAIQEIIGHANIPIIHNKLMKIETARESYKNEHIYGTSFATWDHPIKGFVMPMLNQTFGQSLPRHALAAGAAYLHFNHKYLIDKVLMDEKIIKQGSAALMYLTNPSAMLGSGIAWGLNLGKRAIGGNSNLSNIELGGKIGATIGTIGWGLANAENPIKAASSFAIAGEMLSKHFKIGEAFDDFGNGKGALIGAGIGLAISAIKNPNFSLDMFRSKWIPKSTEKKYELDEYFDRLEYIKYKGLYEQAALRAFLFEDNNINVKSIFKKLDKNKEKIAKLTRKAEKISNKYSAGGYEYEKEMTKLNQQIQALQTEQTAFKGGKYTKAAISYKKAMESTIYGLSEGATNDEILAAIPDQYKDHFMAFMNETSKSERKKILKQLPEYLHKPLQIAWGQKVDKLDSNKKYFKSHDLPNMTWKGWKPNINLKHVKMKTIQNEGMLLSDFGYYESEKSKMEYHMAPDIKNFDEGSGGGLGYLANMTSALYGVGLSVQNISVEPTSAPGLWIIGDIRQTAKDINKVTDYSVGVGIQSLTSLLF